MSVSAIYKMVKETGIPKEWLDSRTMQASVPHEKKGWLRKVVWQDSAIAGIGVFANEDIESGAVIRRYIESQNLMVLRKMDDVPPGPHTMEYLSNFAGSVVKGGDVVIFLPGNCMNHSDDHNIIYVATPKGYDMIAIRDIGKGEEMTSNYLVDCEICPSWYYELMGRNPLKDCATSGRWEERRIIEVKAANVVVILKEVNARKIKKQDLLVKYQAAFNEKLQLKDLIKIVDHLEVEGKVRAPRHWIVDENPTIAIVEL